MNQILNFTTLQGPPTVPSNIELLVLSPDTIQVSWMPSYASNGSDITYDVSTGWSIRIYPFIHTING